MDKLNEALQNFSGDLEKRLEYITGDVPLEAVLTNDFFLKHTKFCSISTFIDGANCADTDSFIKQLENEDLDSYISSNSSFSSWEEMYRTAGNEYLIRNLK